MCAYSNVSDVQSVAINIKSGQGFWTKMKINFNTIYVCLLILRLIGWKKMKWGLFHLFCMNLTEKILSLVYKSVDQFQAMLVIRLQKQ